MMNKQIQHVFLVGAKSLGAYGGYETFIDKLTQYHQGNNRIAYHVACKANGEGAMDETKVSGVTEIIRDKRGRNKEFRYHNARCFKISVPKIGPAQAIYYDVAAMMACVRYIRKNRIPNPIVYIMACRIGPFMPYFYRAIHALGGKVFVNPDGHEWMRAKWNRMIRKYWKYSESVMVRHCDLVICDSVNIEKYIHEAYDGTCRGRTDPQTTYIAYGAEIQSSDTQTAALEQWYARHGLKAKDYYLIVGRFVPENNYETIIREFMESKTDRRLVIITNNNDKLLQQLEQRLSFSRDPRIRFVGTVYDQALLFAIRKNAYGYFHGHEVGGTNPSLLEALGATQLNLLLDVGFNREVAESAALYWNKTQGNLSELIADAERLDQTQIDDLGAAARNRIESAYSWRYIADRYESVFSPAAEAFPKQKV